MKRVFLVIISGILLFLLGIFVSFRITSLNTEEKTFEKYFIYMVDEKENNSDYSLELDEEGNMNLKVHKRSDIPDGKVEQYNYDIQISQSENSVVKKVIKYLENAYKVGSKREYDFYFDYDIYADSIYPDDKDMIIDLVKAMEHIALGNKEYGTTTHKEFGEKLLDEIEDEL